MKNKNNNYHLTIHQRLERLAHHRIVLTCILAFMALSFLKYQTQFFHVVQSAYAEGFHLVSGYVHHDEVTRMPVQYGSSMRGASTASGE